MLVALAIGAVIARPRDQPRQRHLRRLGAEARRDFVQRLQDAQAALVEVVLHAGAARALAEVGLRAVLAGQEAAGQRSSRG